MTSKRNTFLSLLMMAAITLSSSSFALAIPDEGMYAPDQIKDLPLKKRGLKLKPEEIYNPNGGGLSEAIVRLSIGCTAEFVSPEGLILTNHHCGFDALVSASTKDKDYVEDGFRTDSRAGEMPAKGYSVFVTQRAEDVSAQVRKGTESLAGEALAAALRSNIEALQKQEQDKAPKGSNVRIIPMNNGFFYYLFQTMEIKDVRVVYAPPRNIGVFGGDPDNFEWTRHTGDFTFLRAYTAPDGSSAEYSANNVPMKPKRFLTMNIGGVKDGEFVFVMGYPGGTTRYRESQSIQFGETANFPFLGAWLEARSNALRMIGETDDEKRIKFQSEIANFDNYRKVYYGSAERLRHADVVNKRKAEEAQFAAWVAADSARQAKYGEVLPALKTLSEETNANANRDVVISRMPTAALTPVFKHVYDAIGAINAGKKLTADERAKKLAEVQASFKTREPIYEREMIKFYLKMLDGVPESQKFAGAESLFGNFSGKARRSAEEAFATSIAETEFDTPEKVVALYDMSAADLQGKYSNIYKFSTALAEEKGAYAARATKFAGSIDRLRLLYQQGMAEMKNLRPFYPDANSTLRFTYGNIKGYAPREAVSYTPFTTMKGMWEKDTGIDPFDMPQKLKDLQKAQDFGRFGSGDSVVVNLLSTNDIIGGNSGSPLMNGAGEQVGLVFDGNREGLGNDMYYDPNYNRTISVDIRFVLFVTEKFGNSGWVLNEMNIKGGPKVAKAAKK